VNCPPFPISLSFWVELVGACNSIVFALELPVEDYFIKAQTEEQHQLHFVKLNVPDPPLAP
jgi:hypothetical protein